MARNAVKLVLLGLYKIMTLRYHGNWCGPGWSDGQYQTSVRGYAPAIDEFDETCRQHDFAHADGLDERTADIEFVKRNIVRGPKRSVAAVGVLLKTVYETVNNKQNMSPNGKNNVKQSRLRGAGQRQPKQAANTTRVGNDVSRAAPVSVSTRRASRVPRITPTKTGVVVSHRTFLAPIDNSGSFTVDSFATNPARVMKVSDANPQGGSIDRP